MKTAKARVSQGMFADDDSAKSLVPAEIPEQDKATKVHGGEIAGLSYSLASELENPLTFINTLYAPEPLNLHASWDRKHLLEANDIEALALDAVDSMPGANSIEKMLLHQMSLCHAKSMRIMAESDDIKDPIVRIKLMNVSCRLMDTFRAAFETITNARRGGRQTITVKHQQVNVAEGGQAVIADTVSKTIGAREKRRGDAKKESS